MKFFYLALLFCCFTVNAQKSNVSDRHKYRFSLNACIPSLGYFKNDPGSEKEDFLSPVMTERNFGIEIITLKFRCFHGCFIGVGLNYLHTNADIKGYENRLNQTNESNYEFSAIPNSIENNVYNTYGSFSPILFSPGIGYQIKVGDFYIVPLVDYMIRLKKDSYRTSFNVINKASNVEFTRDYYTTANYQNGIRIKCGVQKILKSGVGLNAGISWIHISSRDETHYIDTNLNGNESGSEIITSINKINIYSIYLGFSFHWGKW